MTTGRNSEALMRELLVEDDAQIAASIKMLLINENFICDTTDLGEDGLEVGKLYDYDIILLDLMLPDIDGYEVLRRLRAARVRTPILILSGLAAHAAIGGLMEPFEEVLDLGVPHGLGRLIDAPHRGRWK